jgi:excisionase family DNA binding protein
MNTADTRPTPTTATGLTFSVTAARLGVDVQTVRRWVRNGQAPVAVTGYKQRIPASWVQRQPDYLQHA